MAAADIVGKYAVSCNGEEFSGVYDTLPEAIGEASSGYDYTTFLIGVMAPVSQPESLWSAEDWLDHVGVQDDYNSEWADGWDMSTKEQREELEAEIRPILAKWLDKHDLRPNIFTMTNVVKYSLVDGKATVIAE